jgi:hypothetical protein
MPFLDDHVLMLFMFLGCYTVWLQAIFLTNTLRKECKIYLTSTLSSGLSLSAYEDAIKFSCARKFLVPINYKITFSKRLLQSNRWSRYNTDHNNDCNTDSMAFKWMSLNWRNYTNADCKGVCLLGYNCKCACAGAGLESMWKFPQAPHKGRKRIRAVSINTVFHRGGRKWSQRTETSQIYDLLLLSDMMHDPLRIRKLSYLKWKLPFLRPQEADSPFNLFSSLLITSCHPWVLLFFEWFTVTAWNY